MEIPVIKVRQWLEAWNSVDFSEEEYRRKPQPEFYIFSISAKKLKRLSAVYRRSLEDRASGVTDLGIQRQHDPRRSAEIKNFVHWGFPWSEMSEEQRSMDEFRNLQKPGWLPTSIVVNILGAGDVRNGKRVDDGDLITLSSDGSKLCVPDDVDDEWEAHGLPPIEVIDGQHRLWAFENADNDFELPVVAFMGLDISWQAYLFWSINIKPKKINPSLAFDLYPLLRAQDWLEGFMGPVVYREARAQEIVELLWATKESPWYHRINMLGERGVRAQVTQAAWIRSLLCTYIKPWKRPESSVGGFFGVLPEGRTVIPWSRMYQAMFLMYLGRELREAIKECVGEPWVRFLTDGELADVGNVAFESSQALLNADQGVRGLLDVTNAILCVAYLELKNEYMAINDDAVSDDVNFSQYVEQINRVAPRMCELVKEFSKVVAKYDWRSYEAPFGTDAASEAVKNMRAGFRGSGGYKLIRDDLLRFISSNSPEGLLKSAVTRLMVAGRR